MSQSNIEAEVAPVQVGDPRKNTKVSPNATQDSNRITALDDMNRLTN